MRRIVAACCVALAALTAAAARAAPPEGSLVIGLGYGANRLPTNDGDVAVAAPAGETNGTLLGTASASRLGGFGLAATASHYSVTKSFVDNFRRTQVEWSVYHFTGAVEYRFALVKPEIGARRAESRALSLGLRAGVTIAPVSYEATAAAPRIYDIDADSQIRIGPCVGANLRYQFPESGLLAFALAEKSFVRSTLLTEDIDVGAFTFGGGLAHRFR
jgi:hypothetical protein